MKPDKQLAQVPDIARGILETLKKLNFDKKVEFFLAYVTPRIPVPMGFLKQVQPIRSSRSRLASYSYHRHTHINIYIYMIEELYYID